MLFQLTVELYEMLERVNRHVDEIRFMDPISDFLYPVPQISPPFDLHILYLFLFYLFMRVNLIINLFALC